MKNTIVAKNKVVLVRRNDSVIIMNYPKLKKIYQNKEITTCELRFEGCWGYTGLSFAHRHKRIFYKSRPELLEDFNQTILSCLNCHDRIEYNRELTKEKFNKLRGEEPKVAKIKRGIKSS